MFSTDMLKGAGDPELWKQAWPDIRARTASGPLGVELIALSVDEIVMEFEITDATRQPMGLLHGGISAQMAETAASLHSAYVSDLTKTAPVGIDLNATHISSAREGMVRVMGTVVRRASTHVFHQIEVTHVDTGRLLCTARVTNYLKPIG